MEKAILALQEKGYIVEHVDSSGAALEYIKKTIPKEASVMNGSSTTLDEIGFVEYLKSGKSPWNNLHEKVLAEKDQEKQALLRKQTTISDWYLGSVHAVTEDGNILIASNTGSQLPGVVYNASNLLFVISTKKIVPTMDDAVKRLHNVVVPLEDKRLKGVYGMGTELNMMLWLMREFSYSSRKRHIVLVDESLGY